MLLTRVMNYSTLLGEAKISARYIQTSAMLIISSPMEYRKAMATALSHAESYFGKSPRESTFWGSEEILKF